eukprot:gene5654-12035_t
MLAQPLSVLLTAFAAVAASSVGGETEPGVRLTLMRPSNSTAMFKEEGLIVYDPRNGTLPLLLVGTGFTEDDSVFFTPSEVICDNTKMGKVTGGVERFPKYSSDEGFLLRDINANGTRAYIDVTLDPEEDDDMLLYVCLNGEHQKHGTNNLRDFVTLDVRISILPWDISLAAKVVLIVLLLLLSGTFSGLNLGLMSLTVEQLEMYIRSGTENQVAYSKAILPLRRRGNLLLCTILLGCTLANSVATTLLGTVADGTIAVLASTAGIVIFGEIVPQSICSRHGLMIGAKTTFITWFFLVITSPVAYPISRILDWLLGGEAGTVYEKEHLLEMVRADASANLDKDERNIMTGALTYADKTVQKVMTPIHDVFTLQMDAVLDIATIRRVISSGHSRIPVVVQHGMWFEIKALLFVKDLAYINPADCVPVKEMVNKHRRDVLKSRIHDEHDTMTDKWTKIPLKHTQYSSITDHDEGQGGGGGGGGKGVGAVSSSSSSSSSSHPAVSEV